MIVRLDVTDSTNEEAKRKQGTLPHECIICARTQTAGKGRLGRTWCDAPGDSLLMSVLYKENIPALLPLRAGLAVLDTLSCLGMDDVLLKWPNDVYVSGKKLCGILCEGSPGAYAVVGIGLNIGQRAFSPQLSGTATSLYSEGLDGIDTNELMLDIAAHLSRFYNLPDEEIITRYRAACLNIGKTVTSGDVRGVCTDISGDGSLLVKTDDGVVTIGSGEVCIYEG